MQQRSLMCLNGLFFQRWYFCSDNGFMKSWDAFKLAPSSFRSSILHDRFLRACGDHRPTAYRLLAAILSSQLTKTHLLNESFICTKQSITSLRSHSSPIDGAARIFLILSFFYILGMLDHANYCVCFHLLPTTLNWRGRKIIWILQLVNA